MYYTCLNLSLQFKKFFNTHIIFTCFFILNYENLTPMSSPFLKLH